MFFGGGGGGGGGCCKIVGWKWGVIKRGLYSNGNVFQMFEIKSGSNEGINVHMCSSSNYLKSQFLSLNYLTSQIHI